MTALAELEGNGEGNGMDDVVIRAMVAQGKDDGQLRAGFRTMIKSLRIRILFSLGQTVVDGRIGEVSDWVEEGLRLADEVHGRGNRSISNTSRQGSRGMSVRCPMREAAGVTPLMMPFPGAGTL
jgi:hypothetical protein